MIFLLLVFSAANGGNIQGLFSVRLNFDPLIQQHLAYSSGEESDHFSDDEYTQINPCAIELGDDKNGRYPRLISAEFMTGMVTPFTSSNENGNLFCACESDLVMICNIVVDKGSLIEVAVGMRLND
eukprot:UN04391